MKTNYFKNKNRTNSENVDRVPNHKKLGIQPIKSGYVGASPNQSQQPFVRTSSNQPNSFKPPPLNQYDVLDVANTIPGMNNELNQQSFSTMDGMVVDDRSERMYPPLSNRADSEWQNARGDSSFNNHSHQEEHQVSSELNSVVMSIEPNSYILLVRGEAICSGPLNDIEEEVNALIYGTHELCDGSGFDPEHICVLKKLNLKVGVFLE